MGYRLTFWRFGLSIRQAQDAVTLRAPMRRGSRQLGDRGLQSIEAVIQRQERVPPEGDFCRLFLLGQHG